MKPLVAAVAAFTLGAVAIHLPTIAPPLMAAVTFGQREVDQSRFIVMAVPRGQTAYNLLIVEQLATQPNARACWRVNNDAAQTVEPLLLNFDFTGICGRGTDSNAFSIRMAGEDLGLKYSLRLAERDGVVVLLATPSDRTLPELELGKTRANLRSPMKIDLNPDWRLTRRTYNGRNLPHIYFTNNTSLATIAAQTPRSSPSPSPSPVLIPSPSPSPVVSPSPVPSPSPIGSPSPVSSPSPVASPSPSSYTAQVQQLYREVLNREADAPGLAYHVRRMEQGRTLEQVRQDIQTSPEGRRLTIARVFQQEVGRQPDAAIVNLYSQRIGEQGWSLERVRQDIRQNYGQTVVVIGTPSSPSPSLTGTPTSPSPSLTGLFPERAYFVVIPAATRDLPAIARRVNQLGVSTVNIFQRESPRGPHVAVGPFMQRGLAEQWKSYLRNAGFDARVYFGD
ncbi:MAG: DUF3747 domain-containing protein [Cyanobacteria bacterium]|nr:DUF3747 domain-containing protein [Cyanobacteriota bacterium]MDW8199785.1 DUF3747 domain-containing protein [Cyanobacteriota bacterium SKYGB_h_bin112]